jgi:hypothetical protein
MCHPPRSASLGGQNMPRLLMDRRYAHNADYRSAWRWIYLWRWVILCLSLWLLTVQVKGALFLALAGLGLAFCQRDRLQESICEYESGLYIPTLDIEDMRIVYRIPGNTCPPKHPWPTWVRCSVCRRVSRPQPPSDGVNACRAQFDESGPKYGICSGGESDPHVSVYMEPFA